MPALAQSARTLPILLGHGSGSFGHTAASKYGTRQGVRTADEWIGFAEVWKDARSLNQIVLETLQENGLPVIAFPPSAAVTACDGHVLRWDIYPIQAALSAGLIPLVNGDTIFDEATWRNDPFDRRPVHLPGQELHPRRILLAGIEEGVWADFPACTELIDRITPENFPALQAKISGSASVDVTGGMLEKVESMMDIVEKDPEFERPDLLWTSNQTISRMHCWVLHRAPG